MLGILLNGRYKVTETLGSGGFGQTYLAEDRQRPGGLPCVVKQFKPARQDAAFLNIARRLFFSEVAILKKLGSHGQIPTLIDDFEEKEEFYLVQEYIPGQPLSMELKAIAGMDEAAVIGLLRDVLPILEFIHQNQVIHRDIKPANLIRRLEDNKFVLIDFGAVKEIQTQLTTPSGETALTVAIGTQGYSPSEQLMGKPRFNSDLYSLGMTAIEALTGLHPDQLPTHPITGEVIWRDRVQVSPKLAAILTQMVRYHFSQRYQSAQEVLQALDQPSEMFTQPLAGVPTLSPEYLETRLVNDQDSAPGPLVKPARLGLQGIWRIGIASLVATGCLVGARSLGWLQSAEVGILDRMIQLSPSTGADPRLLVVGITDSDIQSQKQFPLNDRTVAAVIRTLQSYRPRAIGVDLLRDLPQEPGRADLLKELKAPNLIAILNMGNAQAAPTPPPSGVPPERVGFNDFVLDEDGVIRRNLLFADTSTSTLYSFSLRLALAYLATEKVTLKAEKPGTEAVRLGKAIFHPLQRNSGAYQTIDDRGYQLLLRYRGREVARQVSVTQVLNRQLQPDWVQDRIVLIGTTAISGKDLFFTPYSAIETETARTAGVLLHAQMVSQLLDAALEGRSLFWYWPEWGETLWIVGWAVLGGTVAWFVHRPLALAASGIGLIIILGGASFGLFWGQGWVPVVAPALAATLAASGIIVDRAYHR